MIRTPPRKLTELGRLRIGDREPNSSGKGTHPHKLDVFRLTSPNGSLLQFAAQLYGGEVHPWESEGAPRDEHKRPTAFELYTTVNSLDVLIPTMSAVSVSYERWSAGGCQQRCTGETITHCPLNEVLIGQPCTCPEDDQERLALAAKGKTCARILRLNVLLPDLPGIGVWRLETKGHYATAELLGTLDMLQMAGQEHQIIEAVLRLEQRTIKRLGEGEGTGTLKFAVPVLWPKYTPRRILAGSAQALLTPPLPAVHALPSAIEALYGEVVDPTTFPSVSASDDAPDTGATHRPHFEAAIAAQRGDLERWYTWGEKQLKALRGAWTVAQWARMLQYVHEAEKLTAAGSAPSPLAAPAESSASAWVVTSARSTVALPRRDGPAWETLRAYQDDARLPSELCEEIKTALSSVSPVLDSEADRLASTVLDVLAAVEEG